MTRIDDQLRELFTDDRLDLVARPAAVRDIVKGARRRRTRRIVASSVGVVGLAVAVALGSVAVVDVVGTPELPAAVEPTSPAPPTDEASGPPVFDPLAGFGGVRIGMTLDELEQMDGVVVEEYTDDTRTEYCFGYFESAEVRGLISVPAPGGVPEPAASDADFVVATISPKTQVQTPEGITAGSSSTEVRVAYPDVEINPFGSTAPIAGHPDWLWNFGDLTETSPVSTISLNSAQFCAG